MEIKEIQKQVHELAREKGFYTKDFNVPEKLMLIVSELGEAVEAHRTNKFANIDKFYSRGIGKSNNFEDNFKNSIKDSFEDELADACIRIFDLAEAMNIDLEFHINTKHLYNKTRGNKHGKEY